LSVHEFAHAWSAWKLGDDTAARMNRMTLNPTSHIDLVGTILVPLFSPIPFGWAKPVPVDPTRFRRDVYMGTGMAITASAGPVSNLLLAAACAVLYGLFLRFAPGMVDFGTAARFFLVKMVELNAALALFNMLPVPPLDGSRIVDWRLPYRLRGQWATVQQYAPLLLMVVLVFGGYLLAGPHRFLTSLFFLITQAIA
jgi:Zn-dependent protease